MQWKTKSQGITQVNRSHPLGTMNVFLEIHPIVDIFHSGQTNQQTDEPTATTILRAMMQA